ncbi:uncharacterized protein K02A2.6-like [Malaya genurostris]|uniref:uncharacterized protein K02A2.6-like n=1 Tax=Malaya genurostris TaxID=325434 RepID=UPI0026F3E029|nr:uncharacterized protein K02A2.6-like [Malaya genurostris]
MAHGGEDSFSDNNLMQQIVRQNQQMAEQNSRLMILLERFGIQEGSDSGRSSRNPEFIIESLASNIHEFTYDPDNGLVFDRWYRKYEDLFLKDGAKLDDAAKVRLLLRSLSVNVFDRYVNFVLPQHPREFSFEETVKKLKGLFSIRISLFSKRYHCFQLTKNDADDFVTYAGTVNKHCEDFELNKLTADQFKSLVFICGLRSSKDADIRTRLLSKLETNVEEDCKLESLITECQRLHNLKHDTAMVEQKQKTVSSVCTVKQKKTHPNPSGPKTTTNGKLSTPKTPCWQCGEMHFVRDCSFTKHLCRDCKQTGHKEGYCGCYTAKTASKKKHHKVNGVYVKINDAEVTLQFDTASDITIISRMQWSKNLGSPPLLPTTRVATTASGKALQFLGELSSTVTLGSITKIGKLYVAHNNLNLFGLEWIDLFDLWHKSLSAICNQVQVDIPSVVEHYKSRFPDVFLKGLGHCKKTQCPVPFTTIGKVDAELQRLQELGLNAALESNIYPLPVPEDIFSKLNGCNYFSIIDLSDAYLQVEVDDDSKNLLAINTHRGLFRFNRLAPGVKSAPGAFQQLMNTMIADIEGVESFLDDLMVYSKTVEEHHAILTVLFNRMQQ